MLAADKSIRLWHVPDFSLDMTLTGHHEGISDLCWASDSQTLCSASDDKTIRIWSIQSVGPGSIFFSEIMIRGSRG